ncbi:hypothetical protein PC129_g8623 [Phytophthora cactorum]|uniref:Uncharacterized protein n=1 Tax=Phytophthora cactorum TaxID=29920 RepID=A0A8T1I8I4_9STRA|nr:hypothetical protein PC114_g8883 [Phytophthora cactorum]KAG2938082.1 hypothetical protein PC117_g11433 [Phytophthora cactorum]KAG3220623.1 hypothetical protein PC129_g8623 [Phytophthora cactorum]KAG4059767.1 hypothetical protein PC123_g5339 [Phytophthora cactorum]KAG4238636.1 hypothetical protein PC116_g13344 [Phytophthora cactorum]
MRNNWQLDPKYVQFKNPLWQSGMDKLRDSIAERLGYKDPGTMRFAKVAGIWGRSHIETPGDEEPGRYGGHTASSATESPSFLDSMKLDENALEVVARNCAAKWMRRNK